MASILMHLAIAKRYVENNPGKIKDVQGFYNGNLLPDFVEDKNITHYGDCDKTMSLCEQVARRVNLKKFLASNPIKTDIDRGKLLHLYADLEFFNNFMPMDYLRIAKRTDYFRDGMYTFDVSNKFLAKRYGVSHDMTTLKKEIDLCLAGRRKETPSFDDARLLFTQAELEVFIERIATVDLEELVCRFS